MLNAVIYTDIYLVALANLHVFGHIKLVGCGERVVVTHFLSIHKHGGLDMGTLQIERDILLLPRIGHIHGTTIPGFTYILLLRRQEEGELHITLFTILLHIGIEVIAGVVERTRPTGVHRHRITFAIRQHRAWQYHVVVILR